MSDSIFERDEYEVPDEGITSPEDDLAEDELLDDDGYTELEQGYSPPERPRGLDRFGTTLAEERQGETLDQRLAQEEPDPALAADLGADPDDGDGETVDDGEVGSARAGRLVDPDQGGTGDSEKALVGTDVGIDGGAAGAEEAAVHIVVLDEDDATVADR